MHIGEKKSEKTWKVRGMKGEMRKKPEGKINWGGDVCVHAMVERLFSERTGFIMMQYWKYSGKKWVEKLEGVCM